MSKSSIATPDFKSIDSITAELGQPVVFGNGNQEAKDALHKLSQAIIRNDHDSFRTLIKNPHLKDIHKYRPGHFVLRNAEQYMMTQTIPFAAYLGFWNRPELLEIYAEKLDGQSREMFVHSALYGAMYSKSAGPTVKHIIRKYKPTMDRFFADDFRMLLRRKDYDMITFLLANGANGLGLGRERPPLLEAFVREDTKALKLMLRTPMVQLIQRFQELHDFIGESEETASFFEKCLSRDAYFHWLSEQAPDIKMEPFESLDDLREQRYSFLKDGQSYQINGLMALALKQQFNKAVALIAKDDDERLTHEDLYDEDLSSVCVIDVLNRSNFNIFNAEMWFDSHQSMRRLYDVLDDFDRYHHEESARANYNILNAPEKRLTRELSQKQKRPPLKRF